MNFGSRNYVLTSSKAFFHRYADSSFKTKWSGFWAPPIKLMDFYGYKIRYDGQEFSLSWDNCQEFSLSPTEAEHFFKFNDLEVKEIVFLPEDKKSFASVLRIKNTGALKKTFYVTLEPAINMRKNTDEWHRRRYEVQQNEVRNAVSVKANTRSWFCIFGLAKNHVHFNAKFTRNEVYRDRKADSEQRYFLPGGYEVHVDIDPGAEVDVPFIFAGSSKSLNDALDSFDTLYDNWDQIHSEKMSKCQKYVDSFELKTPDEEINEAFRWSSLGLKSLLHESDKGLGIFAGLPGFTDFSARDSFVSSLALLDIGEFETVKKMLQVFIENDLPGKMNHEGIQDGFADTQPLFLLALDSYTKATGDQKFASQHKSFAEGIAKSLNMSGELISNQSDVTWMDSVKRSMGIEVQSLWAQALRPYNSKLSRKLVSKISNMYWNEKSNYFFDSFNEINWTTINPLPVLLFSQTDERKTRLTLEKIEKEFSTPFGVRSRSRLDKGYCPSHRHSGAVWGFATGTAASVMFKYNKMDTGLKYLKSMASLVTKHTLGCMPSAVDADNGDLIGPGLHAWSCASFITAIDRFLFGMKPDLTKKLLVIEPKLPNNWEFMERSGKKFGNNLVSFRMEKTVSGYMINLNFSVQPTVECNLVLPKNIAKIKINGTESAGNKICFKPKTKNEIYCFFSQEAKG
jgi:glycogen debranching enzyme